MRFTDKLRLRLRSLFRRDEVEAELSAEMAFHLEQQVEENLAAGMPPEEARRQAIRTTGKIAQLEEECRDTRRVQWIDNRRQDIRYAARVLAKNGGFTAVAVASMALGIGATTAIFSVVDAVMLKSLPVRDPERLVAVDIVTTQGTRRNSSYPFFEEVRGRVAAFSGVFAAQDGPSTEELTRTDRRRVADVHVLLVSGEYFDVLGVRAVAGRPLTPDDDAIAGPHAVAVISHRLWQSAFGGDAGVIGASVVVKQQLLTVVGVAPREFFGEAKGRAPDLWVPITMQPVLDKGTSYLDQADTGWLRIMARLRPGVEGTGAQAAMEVFLSQLRASSGQMARTVRGIRTLAVMPGARGLDDLRRNYSMPLRVLFGIVCMLLLLACTNVANLLLARGTDRQREIAVRLAIGAKRSRIVSQLMTENALIAGLGGAAGITVAIWGTRGLALLASHGRHPLELGAVVDLRVLLFAAGASIASSAMFGLLPAVRATRPDVSLVVTKTAARRQALTRALVVAQITVSVVLVAGAGLFLQTLKNLRSRDLGFRPERLVQVQLNPRSSGYQRQQMPELYGRLLASIGSTPGVLSVSMSTEGFATGVSETCCLAIPGRTFARREERRIQTRGVTPEYFETVRLPIVEGRSFTAADVSAKHNVVIINRAMAKSYFAGESPVGRRMGWGDPPKVVYGMEVVGVAEDANIGDLRGEVRPMFYTPVAGGDAVHVRSALDGTIAAGAVRQAIRRVDPNLWSDVQAVERIIDGLLATEKAMAILGSLFGLLALALAGVGLYGVTTYTVAKRTHEIGIRIALGATRTQVARMVSSEVARTALAGLALGIALTIALQRAAASLLFGARATQSSILFLAAGTLACVAAVAAFVPTRRAASVDAMHALRME